MTVTRRYLRFLADVALRDDAAPLCNQTRASRISISSTCIFRNRNSSGSTTSVLTRTCIRNFSAKTNFLAAGRSKSSSIWLNRQMNDYATKEAMVLDYKSRAALKLLEIDHQFKLLHPGMTVVDLGYAPGSWSQVAVSKTQPQKPGQRPGRIIGVDLLPAQPPKGASAIQGNFLAPSVQASIRRYLADTDRGRPNPPQSLATLPKLSDKPLNTFEDTSKTAINIETLAEELNSSLTADDASSAEAPPKIDTNPVLELDDDASSGYIARERRESLKDAEEEAQDARTQEEKEKNTVDVVLSDMCEPWPVTQGFHLTTVLTPWYRLMNTSGVKTKDHALSMRLCTTALAFCIDVLKPGGSFVCKFYSGADDAALEDKIEKVFEKVHRAKPDASRSDSRETYFVALRKRKDIVKEDIDLDI